MLVLFLFVIITLFFVVGSQTQDSPKNQACLSLTFDDGIKNQYNIVYPMLVNYNFQATFFIISNLSIFENKELMTFEEIQEIQNNGFEIGSHSLTHPFLTKIIAADSEAEIISSKQSLESRGINITSFAFPYSNYNPDLLRFASLHYRLVRDNYNINSGGFLQNSIPVYTKSYIDEICQKIKEAKEKNLWLILVLHDVSNSPTYWGLKLDDFVKLLDCAQESGIKVSSLRECEDASGSFNTIKFFPDLVRVFVEHKEIGF